MNRKEMLATIDKIYHAVPVNSFTIRHFNAKPQEIKAEIEKFRHGRPAEEHYTSVEYDDGVIILNGVPAFRLVPKMPKVRYYGGDAEGRILGRQETEYD